MDEIGFRLALVVHVLLYLDYLLLDEIAQGKFLIALVQLQLGLLRLDIKLFLQLLVVHRASLTKGHLLRSNLLCRVLLVLTEWVGRLSYSKCVIDLVRTLDVYSGIRSLHVEEVLGLRRLIQEFLGRLRLNLAHFAFVFSARQL